MRYLQAQAGESDDEEETSDGERTPLATKVRHGRRDSVEAMESGEVEDINTVSKQRLKRITAREVRKFSNMPLFGINGTLRWTLESSWRKFLLYTAISLSVVMLGRHGISIRRDVLELPESVQKSYLLHMLQLLCGLMCGLQLSDAATRFKAAMGYLIDLQHDVENLRVTLLAGTADPKLRLGIQCFICWMMVLIRKHIAFYMEDFSDAIKDLIDEPLRDCVLFEPETLWALDTSHMEFLFRSFIKQSLLWDKEGCAKRGFEKALHTCRNMELSVQVRAPTTKASVTHVVVHLFLVSISVFNEDLVTLVLLPFVASLCCAILTLSEEISDPFGKDFHDLPLTAVVRFLALPSWSELDDDCPEAVNWFNRGLITNEWSHEEPFAIPRTKTIGSRKGETVQFDDMRSLPCIAGFRTWPSFLQAQRADMNGARSRGRRMPDYLQWR